VGNTYLEGNYAPVQCEHTITELAATGAIPAHLDGRYLRNGPKPDLHEPNEGPTTLGRWIV
jgi:carotenoid cleavage oxygenase